ncbi:MAG: hypothetical protein JSW25_06850 [Thermoplasmata archaeon]|nr:MAG: hypothetical protein JSW25_06850 [Thermoplasmata archaeon]
MSVLDAAVLVSAMVVGLVSGLYAGFGVRAEQELDRRAELWFAAFMWSAALAGVLLATSLGVGTTDWQQLLGLGMVNGAQVLLIVWSVLHFPQLRTLETPVPRLFPLFALVLCAVSVALLAAAVVVVELL